MNTLLNNVYNNTLSKSTSTDVSHCLHLEVDHTKPVFNITVLNNGDGFQVLKSCNNDCQNQLYAMSCFDVPLCSICSSSDSYDYIFVFDKINYNLYTCKKCADDLIKSINDLKAPLKCDECGTLTQKRCKCLKVGFCSKECITKKWPTHKLECGKKTTETAGTSVSDTPQKKCCDDPNHDHVSK